MRRRGLAREQIAGSPICARRRETERQRRKEEIGTERAEHCAIVAGGLEPQAEAPRGRRCDGGALRGSTNCGVRVRAVRSSPWRTPRTRTLLNPAPCRREPWRRAPNASAIAAPSSCPAHMVMGALTVEGPAQFPAADDPSTFPRVPFFEEPSELLAESASTHLSRTDAARPT